MIPVLGPADPFPPVSTALADPNGLLAAGADLSRGRLLEAYAQGIFPWFNDGDPILWWCPHPRTVLHTDAVHVSRTLRRRLRRGDYEVVFDRDFAAVLRACAAPRRHEAGTWLSRTMRRAYQQLHDTGAAHSVEVWMDGALAGGLYGVAIGQMFFGESMFTLRTDASKIAIVWLAAQLSRWGCPLIDCQMHTEHLASLGALELPRAEFVARISPLVRRPSPSWRFDGDLGATFR